MNPHSPCKLEQSAVFSLRLKWTSLSANLISKSERRRPALLPYETIRWRAPRSGAFCPQEVSFHKGDRYGTQKRIINRVPHAFISPDSR